MATLTHEIKGSNGFTLTIKFRTDLTEIPQEVKDNIKDSIMDLLIFDDGTIVDSPVYNTKFWLCNGRYAGTYGENDKLLNARISCNLIETSKISKSSEMSYAREIVKAIM